MNNNMAADLDNSFIEFTSEVEMIKRMFTTGDQLIQRDAKRVHICLQR